LDTEITTKLKVRDVYAHSLNLVQFIIYSKWKQTDWILKCKMKSESKYKDRLKLNQFLDIEMMDVWDRNSTNT